MLTCRHLCGHDNSVPRHCFGPLKQSFLRLVMSLTLAHKCRILDVGLMAFQNAVKDGVARLSHWDVAMPVLHVSHTIQSKGGQADDGSRKDRG